MTVTKAGELVRTLDAAEENDRKARQGFKPREGCRVGIWRMDGEWNVWAPGPDIGTWWLLAADDAARAVYAQLVAHPDHGAPVVKRALQGGVCVSTREIRPGGAR